MNKIVKGILAVIILLIVAGIIFNKEIPFLQSLSSSRDEPQNDEAPARSFGSSQALTVDVVIATPSELVNNVQVTGEIIPNEFVQLKSEINGKIDEILFREGEYVRKGQILFKVNVAELLAQLEKFKITKNLHLRK